MKPAVWFPLAVFMALAVALFVGLFLNPRDVPSALISQPVPAFELPPLYEGEPGLTSDMLDDGQVSLVNIFASWCGPCRIEHPVLMELAASGIPVHGIAYKDEPPDSRRFLRSLGDPYSRIGVDENGRAAIDFGVSGVPETFVIAGDGRIVYQQIGPITDANRDDLMAAIDAAGRETK